MVSRMTDEEEADGWAIQLSQGRVQVNLVKRWLDDAVRVESEELLPAGKWTHLAVTYDGSRFARGVQLFVNGERAKLQTRLDLLNQTFTVKEPLRIGGGGGPSGRFRGSLDTLLLAGRVFRDDEVALLATSDSLAAIAAIPVTQRTPRQAAKLREYFVRGVAPAEWQAAYRDYRRTQDQRDAWVATFPSVMVMEEMARPRATHLLVRGEYNRPGDRVTPGVPAALQVGARDFPPSR